MNVLKKNKNKKIVDFNNWINKEKKKILLKFLTCGSVDDGKSTLIGRLLHDTKKIFKDQLSSLQKDSKRHGTQGENLDFSLLLDSLQDEKEQGITIDVAYRYFSTKKRKFIIVDAPGHSQYTRNMVTGASNCDVAILLIDARKGLLKQTKRHSFIVTLLGINYLIVAINKMDMVNYKEKIFLNIKNEFLKFSKFLSRKLNIIFIPISALFGENIVFSNNLMPWYIGPTLLSYIEFINVEKKNNNNKSFIFPVQLINHPNSNFRGYSGTLISGKIFIGQKVKILPSGIFSKIKDIVSFDGIKKNAYFGQSITILLKDEIDISRGDLIVNYNSKLFPQDEAIMNIVWMDYEKLILGKSYFIKIAGKKIKACVKKIFYKINMDTFKKKKIKELNLNDIALVHVFFEEKIIFEKYKNNRILGGMIFIDIFNNRTVAVGMIKKNKIKISNNKNIVNKVFELELNSFICKYFPHWGVKNLLNNLENN